MTGREEHPRQIGTGGSGGVFLKGVGAVSFIGGLALIVAAIVNLVRFSDRAGAIGGTALGLFFTLGGRYLWRVPGRPVVELTDDGIIFHADVDPAMMLFTRMKRTATYRWEHIEAIEVNPTRVGMTIWVYLDEGPKRGQRTIPIPVTSPSPDAAAAFVAEIKRLSARTRRDKPTEWVAGRHRAFSRKAFFVLAGAWVVIIAVLEFIFRE